MRLLYLIFGLIVPIVWIALLIAGAITGQLP